MVESNMDNIEQSLVEAKKYLAILLIRTKHRNRTINTVEKEICLFTTGQYKELLEQASLKNLKPSDKYQYIQDEKLKTLLSAGDIMLKLIIELAPQDKKLWL
jgi:hypothetical protein